MAKCVIAYADDAPITAVPGARVHEVLGAHAQDWKLIAVIADPDMRYRRELYFEPRERSAVLACTARAPHDWDFLDDAGNAWCKRCSCCWRRDSAEPTGPCMALRQG